MSDFLPIIISAGRTKQLPSGDDLVVHDRLDTLTATPLLLGDTTASAVTIGKTAALTTIAGNLQVNGTETVVGITTFQEDVALGNDSTDIITMPGRWGSAGAPNLIFQRGLAHTINIDDAASAAAGTNLTIKAGNADLASNVAGGNLYLIAGNAGGNSTGGNLYIRGGEEWSGTPGIIYIGDDGTSALNVGNASQNPTVSFLGTGQITMAGNLNANNGVDVTGTLTVGSAPINGGTNKVTLGGLNGATNYAAAVFALSTVDRDAMTPSNGMLI